MTTTNELTAKTATSKNFNQLSGAQRALFLNKLYSKVEGKRVWKMDFISEFFKEEIANTESGNIIGLMYEFDIDGDRFTQTLVKLNGQIFIERN